MTCIEYINWIITHNMNYSFYKTVTSDETVYYNIAYKNPYTGEPHLIMKFKYADGQLQDCITGLNLGDFKDFNAPGFRKLAPAYKAV